MKMKISKSTLRKIIKEEIHREAKKDYVRHLSTDDVENVYRELGARPPRSFRDIKNIARSYDQTPQGNARIRRDIRAGKVRGIKIKEGEGDR